MTWYSSAESNPFFKQIWTGRLPGRWVGSRSWGVPGNGCVASQRAKAQSLLEIVDPTVTTPLTVSRVWVTSVAWLRSEEHTSELQSQFHLVCRLLLEKKNWRAVKRP